MARIEIFSFHCITESTWGLSSRLRNRRRRQESDEVAFFMALLPIETNGSSQWTDWSYQDTEINRQVRIRFNNDVDSNEDHGWQHSIAFDIDPDPDTIWELLLQIYEVDGGGATSSQAQNIRNNLLDEINANMRPGLAMGSSPTATGASGRTTYDAAFSYNGHGGNDDLMFADVWHVDPSRPMDLFNVPSVPAAGPGVLDPDLQIAEQLSNLRVEREVSRFPPRPDRVIERREYGSSREHANYRFDVHYSS